MSSETVIERKDDVVVNSKDDGIAQTTKPTLCRGVDKSGGSYIARIARVDLVRGSREGKSEGKRVYKR